MSNLGRCKYCQKFFKALSAKTKYCSDVCRNAYNYKKRKKEKVIKTCLKCKSEFSTTRSNQKFCTIICKNLYHKQGIIKIKICRYCGKKFTCTNNSKEYCCNEHYIIAKRKRDKEYYDQHKIP